MDLVHAFGRQLLELVLPSLATIMAGYAVAFLNKKLKAQGIELTAAQSEWLKQRAKDAIQAANEAARRQPLTSSEKRAVATQILDASAPEVEHADRQLAIDAALPEVRAEMEAVNARTLSAKERAQLH